MFAAVLEGPRGPLPSFIGLLRAIREALDGDGRPDEEDPAVTAVRRAAQTTGRTVLGASSRQDLLEAADEVIVTDEFDASRQALVNVADQKQSALQALAEDAGHQPTPRMKRVLGEANAMRLFSELRLLVPAVMVIHWQAPDIRRRQLAEGAPQRPISELLYDDTMPLASRQLLLELLRSEVLSLAIVSAIEEGERLEPWLSLALVQGVIQGVRAQLRLMASLPGVSVPPALIPEDLRGAGQLTSDVTEAAVTAWVEAAHRTGQDPYFPFDAPDDASR